MINTLLEHVPIKLEKSALAASAAVAVAVAADAEDNDEVEDSEDEEEDSETDIVSEEEDEATMLISSDEEAELEAQRIRFHELLSKNLLRSRSSRGRGSVSSTASSVVVIERQQQATQEIHEEKEKELEPQTKPQKETTAAPAEKQSEVLNKEDEENQSEALNVEEEKNQREALNKEEEEKKSECEENPDEQRPIRKQVSETIRRRCQRRTDSNCSASSSSLGAAAASETESCGNIYVYEEQQRLIFNCGFCNLRYDELLVFSKHLHAAHKLFQEQEGAPTTTTITSAATPQRKSARQQAKLAATAVEVKTELPVSEEEHSIPLPSTVCAPLASCGNIFVLNRKKLFLVCGYCEGRYANMQLFEKHIRQQHELLVPVAEPPAAKELDVVAQPKAEVKTEDFIVSELAAKSAQPPSTPPPLPQCNGGAASLVTAVPQPMVVIPEVVDVPRTDVLSVLPTQTPETPPPEEEEEQKEQPEQAPPQPPALQVEQPAVEAQPLEHEPVAAVQQDVQEPQVPTVQLRRRGRGGSTSQKKQQAQEKTNETSVKRGARKRKPRAQSPNVVVVLPAKRKRSKVLAEPTVPAPEVTTTAGRVRRRSATQKSYKDYFVEQQPPSSPESAASAASVVSTTLRLRVVHAHRNANTTTSTSPTAVLSTFKTATLKAPAAEMKVDTNPTLSAVPQFRFPCDQCSKSFQKASRLAEHQRLHTGEKPFCCEQCGKRFRIKMRLSEHQLRHRKDKAFKCDTCGLAVATKQDLTQHQRHHNGDRRYKCAECPKAFVRSSDLKIHVRVHTGEKPYVCEICQKSFRANQNLIVHRRSHGGEKNYKCDYCDKRFMRKIDRKVHHRTHTGEKPYKCEICQRGYSSRVHVRSHIERQHLANNNGVPRERKKPGPKPGHLKQELAKQKKLIEELQEQLLQQIKTDDNMAADDEEADEEGKTEADSNSIPLTQLTVSPTPLALRRKIEHSVSKQQVSVTVSMQVENVAEPTLLPAEKENDKSLLARAKETAASIKKERKLTSYFTVVGQKTEI